MNEQQLAAAAASVDARSELQEYLEVDQQRRRVLPRAALVGLLAGLMASLFRLALTGAESLRTSLITWSHQIPYGGWLVPILFSATCAVLSVALVGRYAPEASGSGIPHLKAVLHRYRSLSWQRVLATKFTAGVLAIGGGLALGREGPTVQMGGAVGDAVVQWLRVRPGERRTLIASGAGAGLAAAFNAPISGLTFVLEEMQRDFHPIVFAAAFVAAVVADIVARFLTGALPVFSVPNYAVPPLTALPSFALLGVVAGILGVLFNRSLIGTLDLFARYQSRSPLLIPAVVGAVVGLIGWFSPIAVGGGHALAEMTLAGELTLAAIPLWFILRFVLTVSSYGTGTAGGIFAPLLVLGALLGLMVGQLFNRFAPSVVPEPGVFAVVGMAAYFTAIVRAPLTGVLLIVEMTGRYDQMLPLLVSCFCAYAMADFIRDLPIYEALLERDLRRNAPHITLGEPMVIEFEVERGAPFVGQEVRALGLPPGCVLVRGVREGREFVPTAQTRLEPSMKLTAVIAPEAAEGLVVLQRGCRGRLPPNVTPEG